MSLQSQYIALAEEYGTRFSAFTDLEGEWNDDHTLYVRDDSVLTLDEIRYVVDHIDEWAALDVYGDEIAHKILSWNDYTLDCMEFHIQYINLQSWLKGAPHLSATDRAHLRSIKQALDDAVSEYQQLHGTLRTDIPQHHQQSPSPYSPY